MDVAAKTVVIMLFLSTFNTKLVDVVRSAIDESQNAPKWVWPLVSFAFGLVQAFAFDLNFVASISSSGASAGIGKAMTGLAIGAGASFVHEVMDAFSGFAKAQRAKAGLTVK